MSLSKKWLSVLVAMSFTVNAADETQQEQKESSVQTSHDEYSDPRDPFESFNRAMWDFNWDILDHYILRPVTVGYVTVVPQPVRIGLNNVVLNLNEPQTFVNSVLQFKLGDAGATTGRFAINTTLGLVGIFDVATELGIERRNEDFGQTLAVWGVGDGPFLMIPALGPNTVADFTGNVVDNLYFPMNILNPTQRYLRFAVRILNTRADLMDQENLINDSLDPYSFVKEGYYQRQEFLQYDGDVPEEELEEFDEDWGDEEF